MRRVVVKSNLVDSGSNLSNFRLGVNDDPSPICPKPRKLHVGATLPEFLKPPSCTKPNHLNTEGRSEILDMIDGKSEDLKDPVCIGCSSSCYSGSPPSRSNNPLVNDIEFIHQMELLSPFTRSKLSDRLGFTSANSPV